MVYQFRFVFVIALLGFAAALLTDKNKLPLALRGLKRVLKKNENTQEKTGKEALVAPWKRLLAFVLILAAFVIAVI